MRDARLAKNALLECLHCTFRLSEKGFSMLYFYRLCYKLLQKERKRKSEGKRCLSKQNLETKLRRRNAVFKIIYNRCTICSLQNLPHLANRFTPQLLTPVFSIMYHFYRMNFKTDFLAKRETKLNDKPIE